MLGLMYVFKLGLSFAAVAIPSALCGSPDTVLKDRIEGAIIGSTLGDALARGTSLLDTTDEIQSVYGAHGLTTMRSFTRQDWAQGRTAFYTHNSVLARMVLQVLVEGRKKYTNKDEIADHIAREMVNIFGLKNKMIDPLFEYRYHTLKNRSAGEDLARLLQHPHNEVWWSRDFKVNDTYYNQQVADESDSGAIMRAWPFGLVFAEDITNVKIFTDYQTLVTHHHPAVRAASVSLAVGVAYALQGASVEMVVNQMVKAAAQFDRAEQRYKPTAVKSHSRNKYNPEAIASNSMLTSDMIRYAADMALLGKDHELILGTTNKRQENRRSFRGFLLGYEADEAVAAAVYIFVRHADNLKDALIEAANVCGRTSLIASMSGALVGARTGLAQLRADGFNYELSKLENKKEFEKIAAELCEILKNAAVSQADESQIQSNEPSHTAWLENKYGPEKVAGTQNAAVSKADKSQLQSSHIAKLENKNGAEKIAGKLGEDLKNGTSSQADETQVQANEPGRKSRSSCLLKIGVGLGLCALAGWVTYKYVVPYLRGQSQP